MKNVPGSPVPTGGLWSGAAALSTAAEPAAGAGKGVEGGEGVILAALFLFSSPPLLFLSIPPTSAFTTFSK